MNLPSTTSSVSESENGAWGEEMAHGLAGFEADAKAVRKYLSLRIRTSS